MEGRLSCITGQVRVSSVTEEKVNQHAVTMKGSIVEWGETAPACMNTNTSGIKRCRPSNRSAASEVKEYESEVNTRHVKPVDLYRSLEFDSDFLYVHLQ